MIVADDQQIYFEKSGSGSPVLFVPGSYSTPAAWCGVQKHLSCGYKLAGISLNGYGRTAETRSTGDADIAHGIRLIEAAAARIGEPLHLVGHSFGGYLALATALADNIELLSLSLFEANPISILKPAHPDLFAVAEKMTADFADAIIQGDADAAALIIDFWGDDESYHSMPAVVQGYCRSTAATNLLDWHGAMAAQLDVHDCARINCDVLLVRGSEANSLMIPMTELLGAQFSKVSAHVVADAGHFLISSHPAQCAALLDGFLASSSRGAIE
jgi:pimeloyl-ACP methyl ester carboxylesterase